MFYFVIQVLSGMEGVGMKWSCVKIKYAIK